MPVVVWMMRMAGCRMEGLGVLGVVEMALWIPDRKDLVESVAGYFAAV